ncbi:MAG: hypothetical protein Q4F38_03240 [Akkermansia sp.]|nr:hypothetical protein [Akkermansia sp.]
MTTTRIILLLAMLGLSSCSYMGHGNMSEADNLFDVETPTPL